MRIASFSAALLMSVMFVASSARGQAKAADPMHAWIAAGNDPVALETWVNERLDAEKANIAKLLAVTGPRTVENTLRPYDDAMNQLTIANGNTYILYSLADTAPMRDRAQLLNTRISSEYTSLTLDRRVYDALAKVPPPANDPATRHYLEQTLLVYRLAGVEKDEATRAKVRALQDKIAELSLKFGRNVADGTLKITANKAELGGLPADYIARHAPASDGTYTLTTDEPDFAPVMDFAEDADLRRRMLVAYRNRAYPQNSQILREVLVARQDLATALGYAHYSNLATADQMIGSPENAERLIADVEEASRPAAQRDYQELLTFVQQSRPDLKAISDSDVGYWSRLYRRSRFDFDEESIRPYFPYEQVQAGIMKIAAQFFRVKFERVKDAVVWDSSVETFDVFDAAAGSRGKRLGRIYLDMHPREGKDKWFSAGSIFPGIRGGQLPEGVMMCNFPGGTPGDPGLSQFTDLAISFHEFGHLMHHILGSQGQWSGQGGMNAEGDFLEAPSQMLEEMFHAPAILQKIGTHYQTGKTIPETLIAKMNASSAFQRAESIHSGLTFQYFALELYNQAPSAIDIDALYYASRRKYDPYTLVEGGHDFASITQFVGGPNNYGYVLDKVIALDFYSHFDQHNLLDGPTAMRYRHAVLEPGASKPAAELVKDFLGRPQTMDAFKSWLSEEFSETAHKSQ